LTRPTIVKNIHGKRPYRSAQNSTAGGIISTFSVQPEDMPLPPLSPLPSTKPHAPRRRKPFGRAIAATIFLFAPFLCFAVFYFVGVILGSVLPFEILISLLILTGILSGFGGLLLYLAARRINYLRMSVGWVALALLVLQIDFCIVFFDGSVAYLIESANSPSYILSIIVSALIVTCMILLCVFSVLMLMRLTRKKKPMELAS